MEPVFVLEVINRRIDELKLLEEEYKSKNNVSGRLNVKTRREELQRLKTNIIAEKETSFKGKLSVIDT